MKANQKTALLRKIRNHVNAQINLEFKGSLHPSEWWDVEEEAAKQEKNLHDYIKTLVERAK